MTLDRIECLNFLLRVQPKSISNKEIKYLVNAQTSIKFPKLSFVTKNLEPNILLQILRFKMSNAVEKKNFFLFLFIID